jgi:hypothetical protein
LAFAYLLLLLVPVAVVVYIIWDFRRKAAQREAVSAGRMEQLLGVATHAPPAEPTQPAPAAAAASGTKATPPVAYVLRDRLLTPPQTLLYYLLKTALPDHVIFAQTPVGAVLDAGPGLAAYAREEQARMFARHVVDFVIADKSTHPVAVVKLTAVGDMQQSALVSMRTWFAAAGVRCIELDAAALPRKESVRALVLDEADLRDNGASNNAFSE